MSPLTPISDWIKVSYLCLLSFTAVAQQPQAPKVTAKSYILMDYHSGEILAANNPDMPVAPASLTKIMTSYAVSAELAAGNIALTDKVRISRNAYAQNPIFKDSSLMWLEVGKQVSVQELLKGLIVSSGNDAAVALAEHIAGSEQGFTELMNHYAEQLGMPNTRFENAHGLTAKTHTTTARDMAVLSKALIQDFPDDYALYQQASYTYNGIKTYNRHPLLQDKSLEVDGLKTGYTKAAGYCLVSSAVKGDMRLIAVVMGTESKFIRKAESKKILSYGFRFFNTVSPLIAGEALVHADIWMAAQDQIPLGVTATEFHSVARGQKLDTQYLLNDKIEAPIEKGQQLGEVVISQDNQEKVRYPLVALEKVEQDNLWGRLQDAALLWGKSLLE